MPAPAAGSPWFSAAGPASRAPHPGRIQGTRAPNETRPRIDESEPTAMTRHRIEGEIALRRGSRRMRLIAGTCAEAATELRAFVPDEVAVTTAFGDELRLAGSATDVFAALLADAGAQRATSTRVTVTAWDALGGLCADAAA